MLCEKCKKRSATVVYNKSVGGKTRSYSLCGECTARQRERDDIHIIVSLIGNDGDPNDRDNPFEGFI
ncbi:MAG: hypothetical protein IJW16_04480 [Clostridia bacterium]|nr:hypothetical protein [Clostridia bacterium]